MDEGGCIIQLAIYLAIIVAILYAIAMAIMAIAACGSVYGTYRAMVCYVTALKRTYGSDEDYEAGAGMKVLVVFILIMLVFTVFAAFSYLLGPDFYNFH